MEGLGKYYLKEDNVLAEGLWSNGDLKYIRVLIPNWDIYEGEGQFDKGKGKMKWKNGYKYNGNFNDLKLSGYEVLTNHIGDTYESIIVNYYLNLSLN